MKEFLFENEYPTGEMASYAQAYFDLKLDGTKSEMVISAKPMRPVQYRVRTYAVTIQGLLN